jgi:hypothetical protein
MSDTDISGLIIVLYDSFGILASMENVSVTYYLSTNKRLYFLLWFVLLFGGFCRVVFYVFVIKVATGFLERI